MLSFIIIYPFNYICNADAQGPVVPTLPIVEVLLRVGRVPCKREEGASRDFGILGEAGYMGIVRYVIAVALFNEYLFRI